MEPATEYLEMALGLAGISRIMFGTGWMMSEELLSQTLIRLRIWIHKKKESIACNWLAPTDIYTNLPKTGTDGMTWLALF